MVGYVDDSTYRSLSARATAEDKSESEFVREAVTEKLDRQGLDDAARRFEIEDRLLSIGDEIADRAAGQLVSQLDGSANDGDTETIEWGES